MQSEQFYKKIDDNLVDILDWSKSQESMVC